VPVDVRILSATHKDLGPLATDGRFRQDLYYRINVIERHVPSSCTSPRSGHGARTSRTSWVCAQKVTFAERHGCAIPPHHRVIGYCFAGTR